MRQFVKKLAVILMILFLIVGEIASSALLYAASVPPVPGDSILLVYLTAPSSDPAEAAFISQSLGAGTLAPTPLTAAEYPTITLLPMTSGTQEGLVGALVAK